jgi:hypothetical protein
MAADLLAQPPRRALGRSLTHTGVRQLFNGAVDLFFQHKEVIGR